MVLGSCQHQLGLWFFPWGQPGAVEFSVQSRRFETSPWDWVYSFEQQPIWGPVCTSDIANSQFRDSNIWRAAFRVHRF